MGAVETLEEVQGAGGQSALLGDWVHWERRLFVSLTEGQSCRYERDGGAGEGVSGAMASGEGRAREG